MTPDMRALILKVYLKRGFTVASPLAIACGASPKSMSRWARKAGHRGKRGREAGVAEPTVRQSIRDRRWKLAIERGEIRI